MLEIFSSKELVRIMAPVIACLRFPAYQPYSGWPGHEWQWRGSGTIIEQRQRIVEIIYTSSDQAEVLAALERANGVRYLYVGPNEV